MPIFYDFYFQNYNKSRIHSYRGVKNIIINLDSVCIFRGEIARASGEILGNIRTLGDVCVDFILKYYQVLKNNIQTKNVCILRQFYTP